MSTPINQYLHIQSVTPLYRGQSLLPITLRYETWGELNSDKSNAILLLTGLSASAHAASTEENPDAGWWEALLGPGKAIDTKHYFVICVNSLGSCMGSTGPASVNPETDQPWRLDFPELSLEDIATTSWEVVRSLGIEQLDTIIGPSMGGMSALGLLKCRPGSAQRLISISSASSAEPLTIAVRSLQREAIVTDPNWQSGNYSDDCWPVTGMRLARKLGMITYRSAAEWNNRFARQPQNHFPTTVYGMNFAIESYLEAHAQKFIGQFDPCCYVYLSRAMDWFDAADQHDSVVTMLQQSGLKEALVIGIKSDILFPPDQQDRLAQDLNHAGIPTQLEILDSLQGHDAFLVDFDGFAPVLSQFLTS